MTQDTYIHFHVCISIVKKIKQVGSNKLFIEKGFPVRVIFHYSNSTDSDNINVFTAVKLLFNKFKFLDLSQKYSQEISKKDDT